MLVRLSLLVALCLSCALSQTTHQCNTWVQVPTTSSSSGPGNFVFTPASTDWFHTQRLNLVVKNSDLLPASQLSIRFGQDSLGSFSSLACSCEATGAAPSTCAAALSAGSGSFTFGGIPFFDPVPPFTVAGRSFAVGDGVYPTGFLIPNDPSDNLTYTANVNCFNPGTCGGCDLGQQRTGEWTLWALTETCCGGNPEYFLGDGPSNTAGCFDHTQLPGCSPTGVPFVINGSTPVSAPVEFFVPDTFPIASDGNIVANVTFEGVITDCAEAYTVTLTFPNNADVVLAVGQTSGSCTAVNSGTLVMPVSAAAAAALVGTDSSGFYSVSISDNGYRNGGPVNPGSYIYYSIKFVQETCAPASATSPITPTPSRVANTPSRTRSASPSATLVSKSATKTPKVTATPTSQPVTPSVSPASRYGQCNPTKSAARVYFTRCSPALQASQVQAVVGQLATDLSVDPSTILVCGLGQSIVGCADSQENSGQITDNSQYMYIELQLASDGESKGFKPEVDILKAINAADRSAVYDANFVAETSEAVAPNEDAIGNPDANLFKPYKSSKKDDTGLIVGLTVGLTCGCLLLLLIVIVVIAVIGVIPVVLGKKE